VRSTSNSITKNFLLALRNIASFDLVFFSLCDKLKKPQKIVDLSLSLSTWMALSRTFIKNAYLYFYRILLIVPERSYLLKNPLPVTAAILLAEEGSSTSGKLPDLQLKFISYTVRTLAPGEYILPIPSDRGPTGSTYIYSLFLVYWDRGRREIYLPSPSSIAIAS
jgi:hypothetical protein